MRLRTAILFLMTTVLGLIDPSWARYTPVFHLDPPGGQRGTVVEVTISGEQLSDFEEILFHEEGGISLVEHEVIEATQVLCHLRIDSDAPLGTHPLRVRTRSGISHLVLFSVGNLEEIFEVEPNEDLHRAQPIEKGTTVNGRGGFEDLDYYAISLEPGERLSVEIEGMRLGENHWDRAFTQFDAELRLYDPTGELVVFEDDTAPLTQDPALVYHANQGGTHTLRVSDSAFAGFGGDRYRLHFGDFPRPNTLSPMGASPGETVVIEWLGDPDPMTQTLEIPAETPMGDIQITATSGENHSPTGFPFRISPHPTLREVEPNGDGEPEQIDAIPCAVEGTIDPAGDVDTFAFEGKAGATLEFRVFARNHRLYESQFGSSLDSRLAVFGPDGEALVWEDDNIGLDSLGECTLPMDGTYQVFVYDHRRKGGPTFPYRLEITPSEPTLNLELKVDFLAYQPIAMPVYRGNKTPFIVRAKRKGFEGDIQLELPNLPPGVTAEAPNLPAGETLVPLLLTVDPQAPLVGQLVELNGVSKADQRTIEGSFKQSVMLAFGRDYNPFLYETIDRVALAVVEEAPYRLEIQDTVIEIEPGGSAKATLRAIRSPGFEDPISISALWTPPGIATGGPTLPQGESEIEIEISASPETPGGVRQMSFVGKHLDYTLSTPFFEVRVLGEESDSTTVAALTAGMDQPFMSQTIPETEMMQETAAPPEPIEEGVVEETSYTPPKVLEQFEQLPQTVSFRHEIVPLLTKFGCNAAACHGGKEEGNPFYLSLFGHNPDKDHATLMGVGATARPLISPGTPEGSLFYRKPSGLESHEGGELFAVGSKPLQLLKTWIEEGARNDPKDSPTVVGLEIHPPSAVLDHQGVTRRFSLTAVYSDGRREEVSDLGTFEVAHPLHLSIDGEGLATAGAPGETTVLGRYGQHSACAQIVVRPPFREMEWPEVSADNFIDERIFEKLRILRVLPAESCEDHEFLRRVYLDTVGVLPTVQETRSFLSDSDPEKRSQLVDRLLERPEFADVWATKWADYLHVRSEDAIDRKAMIRYSDWIRDSVSSGATPAKLVTDILTAEGGAFDTPATNFYRPFTPHEQFAEDLAQVFLGVRLQCAKCHDHPFDRWSMDDYYSFAAFFGRTFRKDSEDRRQALVYSDNLYGEINHPDTGEAMNPKFLAGDFPQTEGFDRRAILADWIVSGTNPWFAKNVANRVWQHFFGVGLVTPVDDFRESNPPTHPKLLEDLATCLVDNKYDVKALIRNIANSSVYQFSCTPRDPENHDVGNYSHFPIRRLEAEVLADALTGIAERPVKFPYFPIGYRAIELPNGFSESHFLTVFGRPGRSTVCAEERQRQPTLSQGLALMNGEIVQLACTSEKGRLRRLLDSDCDDPEILSELYLAALSRPPTNDEVHLHQRYLSKATERDEAYEDILWAVLNSKEFLFQH